ncbi:MAG: MerR family transcriptional regulator [Actinobacteria bacterium]|nr:MerR family transcriptional regulator [Actinomycetota bacterium]
MQMRVEDLARRAEVSVDTIRYYQKQGLIPPPSRSGRVAWYAAEHLELIARIKELQRKGFTLAVIRRFLAGELDTTDEPLVAAIAEGGGEGEEEEFLTIEELAARSAVPLPLIEAVAREGLLVPRLHNGERRFTSADVDIVASGLRLLEAGLPLPELLALANRHHKATRETARRAVEVFDAHVRGPLREADLPPEEKAQRLVEAFRVLLPTITALVAHHFRRVLLEVAQEHLESVGEPAEIAAVQEEARRRLEVVWSQ